MTTELKRNSTLIKSKKEQVLYCVVLEPGTEDLQGDTVTAEEIQKTAWAYAVDSRLVGLSHDKTSVPDADMVETFIAPVDFEIEGEKILKGSWVMAVRVNDSELWQNVEKGDFDGLSIGGVGERTPV